VINFDDDREHETLTSSWLDTVPASKIASIINNNINEDAVFRLRSSPRVREQFQKIITSRIAQNTNNGDVQINLNEDATSPLSPAAKVLLGDASSATLLARIIGAQIHGAALKQLITKSEIEDMEQWLGRSIYVFALRQSQNVPSGLVERKQDKNLTASIQGDGLAVLSGWVRRQSPSNRTKIELLHGDILTISGLNNDLADKIGSVLSDTLVQEAASAYAKLNG
jgi:hypothetical protein